jgi:copper chaperone CopZ
MAFLSSIQHMKATILLTFTAALVFTAPAANKPPAVTANATNRFAITGMTCNGCAGGIKAELKLAPGVASAEVSLTNKLAVVAYDTNRTSVAKLVKVITEAGFEAKPVKP